MYELRSLLSVIFVLSLPSVASRRGNQAEDVFKVVSGMGQRPSRRLCKNPYNDVGSCVGADECQAARGVSIGICDVDDGNREGGRLRSGICCLHLPCSVNGDDVGGRVSRSVRDVDGQEFEPFLPAKIVSCGFRSHRMDDIPFNKANRKDFRPQSSWRTRERVSFGRRSQRFRPRRHHDRHEQLINGRQVRSGSFPWMLALWAKLKSGAHAPTCGAALISSSHAMTAAHCVSDSTSSYVLRGGSKINLLRSAFGAMDVKRSGNEAVGIVIEIDNIVVHPNFNPFNFENDVALIKFEKRVTFTSDVFPICLPSPSFDGRTNEYAGQVATVTGWGCEYEGCDPLTTPTILQEVHLSIIPNDLAMCWFMNDSTKQGRPEYIPSQLFVVGGDETGSTSTCMGDSGSPVVRKREQPDVPGGISNWEVIGLVSWSKGCGRPFRPSVWTRVETFVSWLLTNMDVED